MELSQLPLVLLLISVIHSGQTEERPKPTVIIKPAPHVFRGERVTLRCDINDGGVTSWRYSWYKDDSTSVFSELQEHTFSSVTKSDAGQYSCYGFNGSRWSQSSDTVILTVSERPKPTVIIKPAQHVFRGERVTLRCDINNGGVTSWSYFWYKAGLGRVFSYQQEHTFSSVTESDAGQYSCYGFNGSRGSHSSDTVTLTVSERPKPTVIIKPAPHVFRGETVTLRCDINDGGVTSWRYSWYKDGSVWFFSDQQEHTFSSVTESDAGQYSCEGSERGGSRWSLTSDKVTLTVSGVSKPALGVEPKGSVFTGDSVTLRCEGIQSHDGWEFLWRKDSNPESIEAAAKTIYPEKVSDGGEYSCRARRRGYYTDYSDPAVLRIYERPKPTVIIKPAQHVFRGERVTLRCDINADVVTSWRYSWYKDDSRRVFSELQEHTFSFVTESNTGQYSCEGSERGGSRWSLTSDKVTLTVSAPRAVLSVSPQKWVTEGDPVTLVCEVHGFSTGWTFSWFTLTHSPNDYQLLSDSSRGAGGHYTVSSALNHTGVYVCRAEREKSVYKTPYSNTQLLWVTGVSAPVSLIVSPSRTQHFTSVSLSLSCEDQSNSAGWRVRTYTDRWGLGDCSSLYRGSQTGSTCTISYTSTSHTGVYWCESESGEKHHPVNITVHYGVILESPVHPVTEGDNLTLRCLHRHTTPSNLRADFYKDGSLIQNKTTEMNITNVSKSHEGFYSCKLPNRAESPKSWISVRDSSSGHKLMIIGVTAGLAVSVFIIVFLVLLWRYRNNKGDRSTVSQQQISRHQTSDQKQSEAGHNTLMTGTAQFYETFYAAVNSDSESESSEHMYAEIELKTSVKQKKNKENETESSEGIYSKVTLQTDQGAGSKEATYVEVK